MREVHEDRFIRLPTVLARIGISRSTLWAWTRAGKFPPPVKIGPRAVAWRAREINDWIEARTAEGRGGAK
jgi:prophage regulatory protein